MAMTPEQLKLVQEMMKIASSSLTLKDFETKFSVLINFVKKIEKDLTSKIDSKTKNAEEELREMNQLYEQAIKNVEEDNKTSLSNIKKWALEEVGKLIIKSKINEKISELDSVIERANNLSLPDTSVISLEASKMVQNELLPLIPAKIVLGEELPKMGEPIRDALELLKDDERLDKSAIKGWEEWEKKMLALIQSRPAVMGGGGVGKTNVYYYDLSSSLNGVLKTFSMPSFLRIIDIKLSSAPVLRPTVDWTADAGANTITFTDQISTEILTPDQSLIVLYAI